MATAAQVKAFIESIAPIIQKYAKAKGYKVASPIIAQACVESAFGTSALGKKYHNYFGMKCGSSWKGASVNMSTKEEYTPGKVTNIKDNFRVYANMEEGVKGYFDFINKTRYKNLLTATDAKGYLTLIKQDGYATSSSYITTNMNVVTKYGLTKYDTIYESPYYKRYTGSSSKIDVVFKAVGVPVENMGNAAKRKPVAAANGIPDYKGTAAQNMTLIKLAKNGTLKKKK